jgi:large subunit ribosomal protein L6
MIPDGINLEVPSPTAIVIKGCDKQLVGQFAANIRAIRPPDVYKGKGIRYKDEVVKLKTARGVGAAGK